ncbi:GNAT family N-acetyltransferase [Oceanobacillus iheyensis]|uniref:GNAT family N-acetyltransferase n=1 Tax=Oceanobacillus iheyensis TaxID=182710 RepID=UPI00363D8A64
MYLKIREYEDSDEVGWIRCRVLAFLDTAYYDNVLPHKEKYENPSIELVAEMDNKIVGLIDIEYEKQERTVCSRGSGLGGMIWHIAVHPDYRRLNIGNSLLLEVEKKAKALGLNRLEAWTRDDLFVNLWYEKQQFKKVDSYLHVYLEGNDIKDTLPSTSHIYPVQVFAHYVGIEKEEMRRKYKRVHECNCYEKRLD